MDNPKYREPRRPPPRPTCMPNTARSLSLVALVVATALFAAACQRVSPASIPAADPAFTQPSPLETTPLKTSPLESSPGPPSELVAIASSHSRSNPKALIGAVRIVDIESLDTFIDSYANGEDDSLSQELRDQVSAVPAGKVLVGGVISVGCDIPGGAVLSNRGDKIELRVRALPTEPTPECVVANMTVAIVAADILDVPDGSTSPGTLTSFETVNPSAIDGAFPFELTTSDKEYLTALGQMNLDVPELPARLPTDRRFAFLLMGCADDAAELQITQTTISAALTATDPAAGVTLCDAPEIYLSVIDVPSEQVPAEATLTVVRSYRAESIELLGTKSYNGPDALEVTDDSELLQKTWGIDPDLPKLDEQNRRFAFLLYGCQDDWAELTVAPPRIYANLGNNRPANEQINCAAAEVYLAIFDVPAAQIPVTAELSQQ